MRVGLVGSEMCIRDSSKQMHVHILQTNALAYSPNSKQVHLYILQTPNKCTCIISKLQTNALAYSPNSKQVHLYILQTPNKCTCIFSKLQTSALAYYPNKCTCMFLTTAKATLQLSQSIIQKVTCIHPVRVWRSKEKLSRWACLYSPFTIQAHVPVQLYLRRMTYSSKKRERKPTTTPQKTFFFPKQQKATTSKTIVFKAFEIWLQWWLLLCYHFAWIQVA